MTTDAGGIPGTLLEMIMVTNVRDRNLPVKNPIHVYSVTSHAYGPRDKGDMLM